MQPIWNRGKLYFAEAPRPCSGPHKWTCTALKRVRGTFYPVRSLTKLYELAMALRGCDDNERKSKPENLRDKTT